MMDAHKLIIYTKLTIIAAGSGKTCGFSSTVTSMLVRGMCITLSSLQELNMLPIESVIDPGEKHSLSLFSPRRER